MTETLRPDICIIGAGAAGLSVAAAAAAFGVSVVLAEKDRLGGDCLYTGCVPSKALIAAARRAALVRGSGAFGVTALAPDIDFEKVHQHVHGVIAAIAPNDSRERFAGLGVQVIAGAARFIDPRTISVGDVHVKARRFVIATGSTPAIPPIKGLDSIPYLTNENIFDLQTRPKHLLVIGAGPVGLELAQAFRRLGAAVTVLEAAQPLAKEDPECAAIVVDQLAREGVKIHSQVGIDSVASGNGGIAVVCSVAGSGQTIEGSHLLVATGRRAVLDGLDLDKAEIASSARGIAVNKALRTSNKRVYAIGDVSGGQQFTHVANYQAGLVIRNALFRLPVAVNENILPRVTFTDPELAHVGSTEEQARESHGRIRVLRWPFHDNDRAQIERDTRGHIKVVTTKRGKILGATIVGAEAGELIAMWSLALSRGLNIRALPSVVLPYPTRAEIGKRAAIDFFTPSLTRPLLRRIIAWLRLFG